MASAQQLVERALRQILPNAPREEAARLRATLTLSIKPALEEFGRIVAADDEKRHLQRSAAVDVVVTNGSADLAAAITTNSWIHDYLCTAEIFLKDSVDYQHPLKLVGTRSQLQARSMLDALFVFGFLEGTTLYVKNPADSRLDTLTDTLTIKASQIPATAAAIHASLEGVFVDLLARRAAAAPQAQGGRG